MIHFKNSEVPQTITDISAIPSFTEDSLKTDYTGNLHAYWDNLFTDNPQSQKSEINEEDIWREIFGRDEDEFHFDFDIDAGLQSILEQFDSPEWSSHTDDERISIIEQFVTALADRLDIKDVPKVAFFEGAMTSLGAFSPADNCVEINVDLLDYPKVLKEVIPHEMRHAYQHQRAELQETWMDFLYSVNFDKDNYIVPVRLSDSTCLYFTDYQGQLVEAEARAFANLFT